MQHSFKHLIMKLPFTILITAFLLVLNSEANAQKKLGTETDEQKKSRMAWWVNDRFGMFIHWGLYSLPARHEWVKNHERLTNDQYQVYFDEFNPNLFDPK